MTKLMLVGIATAVTTSRLTRFNELYLSVIIIIIIKILPLFKHY